MRAVIVDGNEFDEKYHWHSGKPLEDDIDFGNDFKGMLTDFSQQFSRCTKPVPVTVFLCTNCEYSVPRSQLIQTTKVFLNGR